MNTKYEILNLGEIELIKLAKKNTDENILELLSNSIFSNVRKCVAKNSNSSIFTINKLAIDSSFNVSYWANKSNNCTKKRDIITDHPCVLCEIDEVKYFTKCGSCDILKNYKY